MLASGGVKIEAELRAEKGTGAARALRREGKIPAIIYGKGYDQLAISLQSKEFMIQYRTSSLTTNLIEISVDNEKKYVLMKDMQKHPVSSRIEHIDFQFVDPNSTIKLEIPLNFINQNACMGIKRGGVLNILHRTISLECSPQNIPQSVAVDLTNLVAGHSIHANDLELPKGTRVLMKEDNAALVTISSVKDESSVNEEDSKEIS